MSQVFVYQTLKSEKILEEALGEDHGKMMIRAILPMYKEVRIKDGGDRWPTLEKANDYVKGEIIQVDDGELKKLDSWEDHYKRREVSTSQGKAFVYMFKGKK